MATTTQTIIQETFNAGTMRRLAEVRGVCVSFFLPDQKPGTAAGTHHAILRQLLTEARKALPGAPLDAVEGLLDDDRLKANGPGLAIFCSTGTVQCVECFRMRGIAETAVTVASHFNLTPLLPLAGELREFFILGLSRQHMRLCRYDNGAVTEISWPAGVPQSLDDAEHGRAEIVGNHATTGMSPSAALSVQFGSANRPDREGAGHHLTHLFQHVDAGLAPVLGGLPLLLGGVADELAAYRRAAKYPAVLTAELSGSIEHKRTSELAGLAQTAATEAYFTAAAKACHEGKASLSDPEAVLRAAFEGRVHRLCVREGEVFAHPMISELDSAKQGSEDWINAAVAETLCAGGEVFAVRAQELPESLLLAALRY